MGFGGFNDWKEFKKHCDKTNKQFGDNCIKECPFFYACKLEFCRGNTYRNIDQEYEETFDNLTKYYRKQKLAKLLK